jgi:hypothetical protein
MFMRVSGGSSEGMINAALVDLDKRVEGINTSSSTPPCLGRAPQTHVIDLTSVSPALGISLTVQCTSRFGDPSGMMYPDTNGLVFGRQTAQQNLDAGASVGDHYSMWLAFGHTTTDAFGYFANVLNANSSDKTVDYLSLEVSTTAQRQTVYRVKAKPSTNAFEFVLAANSSGGLGIGGGIGALACGFRMISDGNFIWAEAHDIAGSPTTAACNPQALVTRCLSATDLTDVSSSTSCDNLKTTFTMPVPSPTALGGAATAIGAALSLTTAASETATF